MQHRCLYRSRRPDLCSAVSFDLMPGTPPKPPLGGVSVWVKPFHFQHFPRKEYASEARPILVFAVSSAPRVVNLIAVKSPGRFARAFSCSHQGRAIASRFCRLRGSSP